MLRVDSMRTKVYKQGHLLEKEYVRLYFSKGKVRNAILVWAVSAGWLIGSQSSIPLRREVSSFSKDLPGCNLFFQSYACIWPTHLETAIGAQSKIASLADRL